MEIDITNDCVSFQGDVSLKIYENKTVFQDMPMGPLIWDCICSCERVSDIALAVNRVCVHLGPDFVRIQDPKQIWFKMVDPTIMANAKEAIAVLLDLPLKQVVLSETQIKRRLAKFEQSNVTEPRDLEPRLKVYVAGKFTDKALVQQVQAAISKNIDFEITYDWTRHAESDQVEDLCRAADLDLKGVLSANLVFALFTDPDYAYRGTFTELGAALATKKRIFAVCPDPNASCRTNCFFWSTGIQHFSSIQEALDQLNG